MKKWKVIDAAISKFTTAIQDSAASSAKLRGYADQVDNFGANIRSINARLDAVQNQNASPVLELQKRVKELERQLASHQEAGAQWSQAEGDLRLRVAALERLGTSRSATP